MVVIQVTHDVQFSNNLSRNLFCDARLTKDGVTLIPVHKIILASFSSKFKRIFESQDRRDGLTVVPVVDFPNLKRVINFIYDRQITLHSKEELEDFLDALSILEVVLRSPNFKIVSSHRWRWSILSQPWSLREMGSFKWYELLQFWCRCQALSINF